jgi:trk/ktr system potassium uptake protein
MADRMDMGPVGSALLRGRRPTAARAAVAVLVGFSALIAIGTVVLVTPLASRSGEWTSPSDALFTSVSATSDTGLSVVDTGSHWSFLGQLAILALMAVGGVGIMASATLAVLLGRRATLASRVTVTDAFGGSLANARSVVRGAVRLAVVAQALGVVGFAIPFLLAGGARDPATSLWQAIFYSASSFNNAGFDLSAPGLGFTVYASQPAVLAVSAALTVVGGFGFVIVADVAGRRRWRSLTLETKLVLVATAVLIVGGAVVIGVVEWANPRTLGPMGLVDKVTNALFMSITPRSGGLSSLSLPALHPVTDAVLTVLMFVGAGSGSTAGGIRVSTVAVLVLVVVATSGRRSEPEAFGRRIAVETISRAVTVLVVSFAAVFLGTLLVSSTSGTGIAPSVFETVSAFGTVGLSLTGTSSYNEVTQLVLAAWMFLGRMGPIALVILLFGREERVDAARPPEQSVRVG